MQKIKRGFTLIEVMVVIVILAILAAIVVPRIMNRPEQARMVKAHQDILEIQNALDLYKLDNGFYPSTQQGIKALVTKPSGNPQPQNYQKGGYLRHMPTDPWGNAYHYANPGQHGAIDIYSYGETNQPGKGTIGNWNLNQHPSSS